MTTASALRGKRVVVVNWRDLDHSQSGGAEIYAWQYARTLREGGAQVRFVTGRDAGQSARESREGIEIHRGGSRIGFNLFALLWLLRHRSGIDAVIDPACGLPSYSPLVLRRGTPAFLIVHHVHQAQFAVHFPAPVAAFGRWMERVAMRRVYRRQLTAAVSQSTATEMREQLGWTGDIRILENGADLSSYDAADAVDKDADRIVVLGRLVAHKRVDLVLDAVAAVRARPEFADRNLLVDVIGHGPESERLVAHAAALGLADKVVFHGYVSTEEKDDLLGRAAVHVCGSDAEGWGQAVIDAAASGVPTVARDVPGLRDSIRNGKSGWLVPDATDPEVVTDHLADALSTALVEAADPTTRVLRAEACLKWAHKFDWSQMRSNARDLTTEMLIGRAPALPDCHNPRDSRVAV
ncbi:glycosyltransferase family 4 protein [Nocardioides sp. CPCC 206347]|uniref:glycosyltransferase family 4 protein n=1 Tax=Nocardioides sp. CPCC 206347 TaxID=3406463 RepID=UPI003B435224